MRLALLALVLLVVPACSSAYYGTMEKLGYDKRDILVDRVEEGREDQEEAKERFASAYEALLDITGADAGELEDTYDRLKDEYDDSVDAADDVRARIGSIEKVARDLFAEWEEEIEDISTRELREDSRALLGETRRRYDRLIAAMTRAADKMDPVLAVFRDNVLFLKHNLNARAVASLEQNAVRIEKDVEALIADMELSIEEADAFIRDMQG